MVAFNDSVDAWAYMSCFDFKRSEYTCILVHYWASTGPMLAGLGSLVLGAMVAFKQSL